MIVVCTASAAGSIWRLAATELVRAELPLPSAEASPVAALEPDATSCTIDIATDTSVTEVDVTVAGMAAVSLAAKLLPSTKLELFVASTVIATMNVAELSPLRCDSLPTPAASLDSCTVVGEKMCSARRRPLMRRVTVHAFTPEQRATAASASSPDTTDASVWSSDKSKLTSSSVVWVISTTAAAGSSIDDAFEESHCSTATPMSAAELPAPPRLMTRVVVIERGVAGGGA